MKMASEGEKGCGKNCTHWAETSPTCKDWGFCKHPRAQTTKAGEVTVSVRFLPQDHICLIPGG